jgi:hypothetical protein
VRANIIERPTSSQCAELFGAIVRKLSISMDGEQALFDRAIFRRFMQEINSIGGFRLLDYMASQKLDAIVDCIIKNNLNISTL